MKWPALPELFDIVPDAIVLVDGQGRIAHANASAERLFGYALAALVGMDVESLMPVGMRARHLQHRADYMSAPRVRPMGQSDQSLIGQRADGRQFPVEIALSPIVTDAGRYYLASVRDISESQRARQALVRARYDALIARLGQMALYASSEQQLVRALPELLASELQADAVVLAVRGHEEPLLELSLFGELDAGHLSTQLRACWPLLVSSLQADRANVIGHRQLEPLMTAAQPFACGVAALLRDRDPPMGLLLVLSRESRQFHHDALHVTQSAATLVAAMMQRRRTEEQLAHAQRLDAIGQLTGGIAHDFNNLLTIVSGSLQLLQEECADRPAAIELIEGALHSVRSGADLTSQLLAFARRQTLAPRAVAPAPLIHDLGVILGRTLGDTFVLSVECASSVPPAFVDATYLETALVNLVLNARDAMPQGGTITLSVAERWVRPQEASQDLGPGHYIVIQVSDAGTGMPPEVVKRAIDPFYTTKARGRGSGLGLSMVYGFTRQSNGTLRIESEPGRGTTVSLYLPVARSRVSGKPASLAEPRGSGESILVVEDEPAVRRVATAFLRSAGFKTLEAADAESALAMLDQTEGITLLFSDIMLGNGMSGHALADRLRARFPQMAVLLTTGYADTSMDARHSTLTYELLRKPYRKEELLTAVKRLLA